ncbi:methylated-DNA--[protein]-cysteine S-methyltransferase [uncultured Desulfuromonas sp.]|uniref:methylated-DNA--[protein]-cysteine S-methyltransferase n=1 Tax=uncultured Desulfuromonas sp. TaxID=181013 RepID=UPI002623292D|nr:methylated-DNA--[protein]-cysteine S-methyltransferase [uncultured Desulfuromonas sp.]
MNRGDVGKGTAYALCRVPVGWVGLVAREGTLVELLLRGNRADAEEEIAERHPNAVPGAGGVLDAAAEQLEEYFAGERRSFDLPLDLARLSPFARQVSLALANVPYGETVAYEELASLAGRPGAARAVGRVMAANPYPLAIPCHRVMGAGGKLTGYSAGEGIATKAWLLDFERKGGA